MKIMLLFIMLFCSSCVSSAVVLRDFSTRVYYPCEDWQTEKPEGKFCYHYCARWRFLKPKISENCTLWSDDIIDPMDIDDWDNIKNANFKLSK